MCSETDFFTKNIRMYFCPQNEGLGLKRKKSLLIAIMIIASLAITGVGAGIGNIPMIASGAGILFLIGLFSTT